MKKKSDLETQTGHFYNRLFTLPTIVRSLFPFEAMNAWLAGEHHQVERLFFLFRGEF
jgi:hypothetical protein